MAKLAPIATALLLMASDALASLPPLDEVRYCGDPKRDANGVIERRADVRAAFKRLHLCPATGRPTGACPGWQMDHVIPLACGGCDSVSNLQWLPDRLKSATGGKDGFERRIYCQK